MSSISNAAAEAGLKSKIDCCDAFASATLVPVQDAQLIARCALFHKCGDIAADLTAVVALIYHKVVAGFTVEDFTRQAVIVDVRQQESDAVSASSVTSAHRPAAT